MNDCIERKRAIELIQPHVKPSTVYGVGYLQAIEHATEILELMPAADVHPVKHAYWLGVGKKFSEDWTCSNCMRAKGKDSSTNFCSYCGADMRGDTNG